MVTPTNTMYLKLNPKKQSYFERLYFSEDIKIKTDVSLTIYVRSWVEAWSLFT